MKSFLRSNTINTTHERHGKTKTQLYRILINIIQRCTNPNHPRYSNYHNRGICEEWRNSFVVFEKWAMNNGYRENLKIERKDNSKGYFPGNCRWIDRRIQCSDQAIIKSGYIGVAFEKWSNRWTAGIKIKGKRTTIGRYDSPFDAAIARNRYITDHGLTTFKMCAAIRWKFCIWAI